MPNWVGTNVIVGGLVALCVFVILTGRTGEVWTVIIPRARWFIQSLMIDAAEARHLDISCCGRFSLLRSFALFPLFTEYQISKMGGTFLQGRRNMLVEVSPFTAGG